MLLWPQRCRMGASCARAILRAMADNLQVEQCMHRHRGAVLFMAPGWRPNRRGVPVQIVEVFALRLARGFIRDPQGRLLMEANASLAQGRTWCLAKACQLVRNDARPERWVVLQRERRAWALFWAGGGLQHCREALLRSTPEGRPHPAGVPADPESLLALVLDLEPGRAARIPEQRGDGGSTWRVVACTSLAWLLALGFTLAGLLGALERQDRKLNQLLERQPADGAGTPAPEALSREPAPR